MAKYLPFFVIAALLQSSASMALNVSSSAAKIDAVDIQPELIPDKATDLAQYLYSSDVILADVNEVLDRSLPIAMKANPEFAVYEETFPGFSATVAASIKPLMLKAYSDKMPLLWFRLSQEYKASFTTAEIDILHGFYSGPVGTRFIAMLRANADSQAIVNSALKADASTEDVATASKAVLAKALRKTQPQLSNADRVAILRFENTPVGRKLSSFGAHVQALVLDWDLYFTQKQREEFALARSIAIENFLAKSDAETAVQPPAQ